MTDFLEPARPIRLAILGSTGSIGRQALDVVRANPGRFEVTALAAGSDSESLLAQAKEFGVALLGLNSGSCEAPPGTTVVRGPNAAEEIAGAAEAQIVLNAVVGAAGLRASMATILTEKTLALANKESLVAGGELVMSKAAPGQLRPVDSEHSALWQVLESIPADQVRRVVLTGSGGPFLGYSKDQLSRVTVAEALRHPVWDMGPKITIDSATLMNKGLEVIEAHFLFGFTYEEVEVVIHPQGLVHGMVETTDGAVFAHAAKPDMRLPIQVALGWPERLPAPTGSRIDWTTRPSMTFEPPDTDTFRCLPLAYEAGRRGGTFTAVLSAANEVAVEGFIQERLELLRIPDILEAVLGEHDGSEPTLEGIMEADAWARRRTSELLG